MLISKESQVRDLQNEFQSLFPYLKIEFYKDHQTSVIPAGRFETINPSSNLSLLRKIKEPVKIDFNSSNKVSEVKAQLKTMLDLNTLIFRKSGSHWIETSLTQDWTLQQQNEEGKLLSES